MKVRALFLASVAMLATAPALADTADERKGRILFDEGTKRAEAHDYEGALERFRSAYARYPNGKILLNIATMLRELGRRAEAAEVYEQFLADPSADATIKPDVQEAIEELDAHLGKLSIKTTDPKIQ